MIVGAPINWGDGVSTAGAAYAFRRVAGTWVEEAKLSASDGTQGSEFGNAVHTDGRSIIVGAYKADVLPTFNPGAAYVYVDLGNGWSEQAKLVASDRSSGDQFGWSVNILGNEALVGAPWRDSDSGALYVFQKAAGVWSQTSTILASDSAPSSEFGWAVDRDDSLVVSSAWRSPGPPNTYGAAYILRMDPIYDSFCFGEGSGSACPCANAGSEHAGCANSDAPGAILSASGSVSTSADDLEFAGTSLASNQPALLFVGTQGVNGGAGLTFGDGLRCVGGTTRRLGVQPASSAGVATWGPGLTAAGAWSAGDVRNFQIWYRDPQGPCGSGFNLSQAVTLQFVP